MGSNRLELILSLIDDSERDLREGMKKSCDCISSNLLKHIQHMTNNANDNDTFERINVNAVAMARRAKPGGWDYALTACYSMKNHMKFLSTAVEDILGEVRLVMADYVSSLSRIIGGETLTFEDTKVFENRPHSLGGVRPPDPKSIASAAILQGEGLADIDLIREAMSKIRLENDIFERENEINKRLIRFNYRAVTGVVYAPTPDEDEEEEKEEGDNTQLMSPVTRSVDDGATWRPPIPEGTAYPWWWYDFSNVWGDKGLSIKALTDFMTRVVAPKALMARAIVTMCVHLRNCAQAIIETDLYKVMKAPFNAKLVWDDIINVKLEWFMLIAVLILFLDDKKDKFTSALLKDDTAEENVPVLLTNVVESLPPWLLVQEWAKRNLYSWPDQLSEETESRSKNRVILESALASSLVDRFVICRPGEEHPILLFVNDSNRTLRHRISFTKAEFLKSILNELKNEAMYGTQWLIRGKESSSGESVNSNNFSVFIKNDESSSMPLFLNPMFRTKLLSSRNHQIITNSIRPLLTPGDVGKASKNNQQAGGEWITLDLKMSLSRDLSVFWKNVSPRNVNYCNVERHLEEDMVKLESEIEERRKSEEEQTREIDLTEDRLKKFLSGLKTASDDAEKAIFLTCLWKGCANKVMRLLSSTAEL